MNLKLASRHPWKGKMAIAQVTIQSGRFSSFPWPKPAQHKLNKSGTLADLCLVVLEPGIFTFAASRTLARSIHQVSVHQ
jgi:hypothetical protein